eukprot:6474553-Alexandrium_andersonii.AAC.1
MSLRRDGYPVTWASFQKAWALALPNIRSIIEKHDASLRVPLSVSRMEYVDALSAAACFRLYTDFVDLLYAEPLQHYVDKIRNQLAGVCIDSLFGWCDEAGDDG